MTVENDFLPFAAASGANVLDQATYAAASATATGFVSGTASSAAVNKTLRQASLIAAMIADFIVSELGVNVIDDGTTATIMNNFIAAIRAANPSAGGTVTGVTGNAPITSSGGTTPAIGISAATEAAAGSMSAADKIKLDSLSADNAVVHIAGTETITGAKTFSQSVIASSLQSTGGTATIGGTAAGNNAIQIKYTGEIDALVSGTSTGLASISVGALTCTTMNATGSVTATGGFQISDRRIKKNIRKRAVQRGLALKVAKLFSEWDRIADGVHDIGLIAQGLKRIAARYVVRTPGTRGILAIDKAGVALEASMDCALQLAEQAKEIKALREALKKVSRK